MNQPSRRTTASEWEVERARQHMGKAMAIIAKKADLAAAEPHVQRARECFLRAFAGQEDHPVVQGLQLRLDAMLATIADNAARRQS